MDFTMETCISVNCKMNNARDKSKIYIDNKRRVNSLGTIRQVVGQKHYPVFPQGKQPAYSNTITIFYSAGISLELLNYV